MIASLGGAEVASDGARNYPGSGGMIGGLSFPGGNWAYWGGAGKMYNRFTPNDTNWKGTIGTTNGEQCEDCGGGPGVPLPSPEEPPVEEYPQWIPGTPLPQPQTTTPTTPTTTTTIPVPVPTVPTGGGVLNCVQDCDNPTGIPSQTNGTILQAIQAILAGVSPRTAVQSIPPLFSFNPPSAGGGSQMNTKSLVVIGALIFGAFFLYKKYA